ncbi:hypothetical protein PLICRDRAFT_36402 [Plicaturopsis crispa FD-325 SS-3]|nr:hypothetical protein PLICRDRAFT_36402 [Plicaturopsis crispa FD-325 SS-3]
MPKLRLWIRSACLEPYGMGVSPGTITCVDLVTGHRSRSPNPYTSRLDHMHTSRPLTLFQSPHSACLVPRLTRYLSNPSDLRTLVAPSVAPLTHPKYARQHLSICPPSTEHGTMILAARRSWTIFSAYCLANIVYNAWPRRTLLGHIVPRLAEACALYMAWRAARLG